ncbi:glutamic acid-rich protein precursor, putative [Entamoeba histolytica HM-3:IMSS]|uniref:Glutamic acid-rich protein, putative n=1 Tax=Entamoeba histolytica HM-3:IMSS TaxID=885315 RepID=M7WJ24_ENTHI|nr:glutamic acid-rich protein precursor, putative [Entamoeba histolytica HM-3:IMSS]
MPKHQNKNKKGSSQQTKVKERFIRSKTEKKKKEIQKEEEIPKITEEEKEKYLQKFKRKYVEKEKKEQLGLKHPNDLKTPIKQKEIGIETAQRVIQPIIKHNESKITFSRTNKRNENITSQFKETSDGFDIPKTKTERQKTMKLQTEIKFNNQSFDDESIDQNDYRMITFNEIEQPTQENNVTIQLEGVEEKNKTTTFTENENKISKFQTNQQEEQSEDSFVIHRNHPIETPKKDFHLTEIEQSIQPMQFETNVEISETSYKTPIKYQVEKKQLIEHDTIQHTSPRQSPKKIFKKEKQFNTTVIIPKKQEETKKLVLIEDEPINKKDINKRDEEVQEKVTNEDNQEMTEETSSILSVMSFGEEREMNNDKIPMEVVEEEEIENKNEESTNQNNVKDDKVITSELMSKIEEQTTLLSVLPFGEDRIKGINGLREMKEIDILENNEQKQKESIKKSFTQERKNRINKKLARPHEMIQFNDGNQVISQMSVVETRTEEEPINQEPIKPVVQEPQKISTQKFEIINNEIEEEVKVTDIQPRISFIEVDIVKEVKEIKINGQNKIFCKVKEEEVVCEKYILKPCRFLRLREKEQVEFPCIPPRIKTPPLEHHMVEEEKHFLEPELCFNDYYRLKPKCSLKEELCIVPLRKQLNWKALNNPQMGRIIEEEVSIPMGYFSRVFLDNDTDFEDDFVESTNSKLKIVF